MSGFNDPNLASWAQNSICHDDGRIPICFGLAATLYFHDGHTEDKRRAALTCFNEYEAQCHDALRWHSVSANTMRMKPTTTLQDWDMSPYMLSKKWDTEASRNQGWAFYWHGGKHPDDASPFKIFAHGSRQLYAETENALSFLQVSFPIFWFEKKSQSFVDIIQRWSGYLEPYHGYGGITLITSPARGLTQLYAPKIAGFAARYPGIEIDHPMAHREVLNEGIKGGNWLTILSDHFVERLGGRTSLQEQLDRSFALRDYEGGTIIGGGHPPEVGDRNKHIDTPQYRQLARILKPIRILEHPGVYPAGPLREGDVFLEWLARFDDD